MMPVHAVPGAVAEWLNPRSYRFHLPNNLHMGASALKWGDSASFGRICSPLRSPDLLDYVETNGTALLE